MAQFTLTAEITASDKIANRVTTNQKAYTNAIRRVLRQRIKGKGCSVSLVTITQQSHPDPDHEYFVSQARKDYTSEGEIEIDSEPIVSSSEEGAYVQAWVWVDRPAEERRDSASFQPSTS